MKIPKKYLTKNPRVMRKEIEKHAHKKDDDPSAYKEWDADYKSGKAGKGKKEKTKVSNYTKKYKEMFGESESTEEFVSNILTYEQYQEQLEVAFLEAFREVSEMGEEALNEGVDDISSPVNKALKKKSDRTRFPMGILKQVWKRGYAAWKTGHVPGTTPQQWAMARVNSFVTGGKTTKMHDKALYKRAKANLKQKKK